MKQYLDDRMYVMCLARFVSEKLIISNEPVITLGFENIENKRFYTNQGIVTSGKHCLSICYPANKEEINNIISQNHSDKYAVLTFKNTENYPPVQNAIFYTKEDALHHLINLLGLIPMYSLGGKPIEFKDDDEFRDYIFKYNMEEFYEKNYLDFPQLD
ncbi:hypothetical protein [Sulfurospirillum sp. MES]|uniref:hypothetical protein n=1 Tax=Sulfurospirillum sp. MES TaxID=1565314 RepID=UPI000542926C|nr:hypothetical protein [Sulfurospirillum sp. MES]KHG33772.1 MAG: hypothetical protein OA34_08020 [Sulfurospirillum sp. MES]